MWIQRVQKATSATMALFALLASIKFLSLPSKDHFPHHSSDNMANNNIHKTKHEDDFDLVTNQEVQEIRQQQTARAVLGIRPTAAGARSSSNRFLKKALRSVGSTMASGAKKVVQKMADGKKSPQDPTPEQALCPCLADPVNGWMSCKIYEHVRAKLKKKGIVAA
ncbi:uncharacterized protein J3D65DRAFT_406208 [Phyllosticta citribraziliensis]|uniref:Uncharacterized protein n=1 Tax=Phyllosticta citribraziliensis TaxID=989973 RepID=A0ABR1LLU0_9PEZI